MGNEIKESENEWNFREEKKGKVLIGSKQVIVAKPSSKTFNVRSNLIFWLPN